MLPFLENNCTAVSSTEQIPKKQVRIHSPKVASDAHARGNALLCEQHKSQKESTVLDGQLQQSHYDDFIINQAVCQYRDRQYASRGG
ncbi:MAG TPA: hypothetical protein DCZ10_19925 [Pelotomaculum sp.]|nr:hypothetical protein [Pelotomaculum sp.]